jgi:hypothetical protein
MFTLSSHGRSRSPARARSLSNRQLARTLRAMAQTYVVLDRYRAAVLEEAACRILPEE